MSLLLLFSVAYRSQKIVINTTEVLGQLTTISINHIDLTDTQMVDYLRVIAFMIH
jgi:hypothetical protein